MTVYLLLVNEQVWDVFESPESARKSDLDGASVKWTESYGEVINPISWELCFCYIQAKEVKS